MSSKGSAIWIGAFTGCVCTGALVHYKMWDWAAGCAIYFIIAAMHHGGAPPMRHPDHDRVELAIFGRTLQKERNEAMSDIPECYDTEEQRERMRKIVGAAFDCGVVAAMKAIYENSDIEVAEPRP